MGNCSSQKKTIKNTGNNQGENIQKEKNDLMNANKNQLNANENQIDKNIQDQMEKKIRNFVQYDMTFISP